MLVKNHTPQVSAVIGAEGAGPTTKERKATKRDGGTVLMGKPGAGWANHLHKINLYYMKSKEPALAHISLQMMVSRHNTWSLESSESGILLLKSRHSHWVQLYGEGTIEKSKVFEKTWNSPTSKIHASTPCKDGCPTVVLPPLGQDAPLH